MLFRKKKGNNSGSITVEASIVIPIVILSITAFIFMGFLLYQRSLMQSAADRAAESGAASWKNPMADTSTGKTAKVELESAGLYWRILDTGRNDKLDKIKLYTETLLKKNNIICPENSLVKVDIIDYKVYRKLEVILENSYRMPIGGFLRIFGASDHFIIRVKSCAVIDDPTELIRNTDLLIDIEKELEDKYPGVKNLAEKTRSVISDMKGKIGKFLE